MAYISTEQVKEIRDSLKREFPAKDGWKFSVRREHASSVTVAVLAGPIEFCLYTLPDFVDWQGPAHMHPERRLTRQTYAQVNQYHYKERWDAESEDVFDRMLAIIKKDWWDESDSMTDYFNTAFYFHLNIGKWDKPYEYRG